MGPAIFDYNKLLLILLSVIQLSGGYYNRNGLKVILMLPDSPINRGLVLNQTLIINYTTHQKTSPVIFICMKIRTIQRLSKITYLFQIISINWILLSSKKHHFLEIAKAQRPKKRTADESPQILKWKKNIFFLKFTIEFRPNSKSLQDHQYLFV
jgi:hypothetical protein